MKKMAKFNYIVIAMLMCIAGVAPVYAGSAVNISISTSGYTGDYIVPGGWATVYTVTIENVQIDTTPTAITLETFDIQADASISLLDPAIQSITFNPTAATVSNPAAVGVAGRNTINCAGFSSTTIAANSSQTFYVAVKGSTGEW